MARAQREQRVLRAASRMDTPERGSDTEVLLNKRDAAVKIARAKEKVIEQGRHLVHSPGKARRSQSRRECRQKRPSRSHVRQNANRSIIGIAERSLRNELSADL